jgi:hypothetical protein
MRMNTFATAISSVLVDLLSAFTALRILLSPKAFDVI